MNMTVSTLHLCT